MEKQLAILGLGHALYAEDVKYLPEEQYVQEAFKRYGEANLEEIEFDKELGSLSIHGKYRGRKLGFHYIPFGLSYATAMNIIFEENKLEAAAGVGFCGSLHPDIEKDTVIIARKAAMSPFAAYDKEWKDKLAWGKADERLAESMLRKAEEHGYEARLGTIFTVINTRCETPGFIAELREAGFDGVEMETAALYQIANAAEVPIATMLYVSDSQALNPGCDVPKLVQELEKQGKHIEMTEIARDVLLEHLNAEEDKFQG
ncbi:MAG: hypothetical protein ACE5J7_01465 [Candidatus Aenigmatarchaeota archaeon]